MAGLDDIIQKVLLEGDTEVINQLKEVGATGRELLAGLAEEAEKGGSPFEILTGALAILVTTLAGAAAAVLTFVESQDALIQKTNQISEAFGLQTAQLSAIEAAYAAAGVSSQTFESFAQKLTTTIAREWPSIAASVRTASTVQAEAQEKVVASTLRVREAQINLANSGTQYSNQLDGANQKVASSYLALEFAAQHASEVQQKNYLAIQGAALSLESAEARLAELQGKPPSAAEKQALQIKEAELAVSRAQEQQQAAFLKQSEDVAAAKGKQQALELAAAEAVEKRAELQEKADLRRQTQENAVKEAISARASAQEKADQLALTSVPSIASALQGVADKNKGVAEAIDLSAVSVENLKKGVIAAASAANNGLKPEPYQVLAELTKILSNNTEGLISKDTELALVQGLGQRSMQASGASVYELRSALKEGSAAYDEFSTAAEKSYGNSKQAFDDVEKFQKAFESFKFSLEQVSRSLAAAASPAFTEFLKILKESLDSDNGLLHDFVEGIKAISTVIGDAIGGIKTFFDYVDKAFGLEKGTAFKVLLLAVLGVLAAFGGPITAVVAGVTLIIVAAGKLRESFGTLKEIVGKTWDAFKDSAVGSFLLKIIGYLSRIGELFDKVKSIFSKGNSEANVREQGEKAGPGASPSTESGLKLAGGGHVRGPGTPTSDSIFAYLSDGEFVQRAAAVKHYGVDFMTRLNNLEFPGFAMGGLVSPGARFAGAASSGNTPSATLNLTLDNTTYGPFTGPADVVDQLSAYAVGQQTSQTGRQPSWVK